MTKIMKQIPESSPSFIPKVWHICTHLNNGFWLDERGMTSSTKHLGIPKNKLGPQLLKRREMKRFWLDERGRKSSTKHCGIPKNKLGAQQPLKRDEDNNYSWFLKWMDLSSSLIPIEPIITTTDVCDFLINRRQWYLHSHTISIGFIVGYLASNNH